MRRAAVAVSAAVAAVVFAATAGATVTSVDASGTVLLNGAKVFPIVLAKGPPRGGTTPSGADALSEAVGAGVNFFKVGPATTPWTSADITDAVQWDQAAAALGAFTWINLSTESQAIPGSSTDSLLQQVITTLKGDPTGSAGIGMWRGADEPWWSAIPPSALQFAYCRSTGRGDRSWCAGEPLLDQDHLWVTVEAPRGTVADLAPYSAVTDTHGVDDYPVTLAATNPDLHQVGMWTSTIGAATPSHAVWTSLQVCASGSYNANGNYVLPTRLQERYMIYDAIINGARSLAFYGGNNPNCWNSTDTTYDWSWTFWNDVLKGLVQEINAQSPLAPALVDPGSTQTLNASDSTTEVISRQGSTASDLWVIASRSGSGNQPVTISGLPSGVTTGTVYTENRPISVANGSFTDTFSQWDVHVYYFSIGTTNTPTPPVNTQQPTISGNAAVGSTLSGSDGTWSGSPAPTLSRQWRRCDIGGASCVSIAGATAATYVLVQADAGSTIRLTVTGANSGGSSSADSAATAVVAGPPVNSVSPAISGVASRGQSLTASSGIWSGYPAPSFGYQWRRCDSVGGSCVDIGAATAATYTVAAGDLGKSLLVIVAATNASGSAAATSTATAPVTGPPLATVAPSVSGTAASGQTLTASTGSWSGFPAGFAYGYAWYRCDDGAGGGCVAIGGATTSSYVLVQEEVGHTIKVRVTASNGVPPDGAADSALTAFVSAPPANASAPIAAPSAGGGGGGGGVLPDLRVDLTSNAGTPPPVGSEVIYFVKVTMKNLGNASAVLLDVNLPAGFTVTKIYADRGSGCTGTAPKLTCDAAWVVPGIGTNVTIWGTVGEAGPLVASATATSLVETELVSTLADNTAQLTIAPTVVTPAHRGPPDLRMSAGAFTPRGGARVGAAAIVRAAFSVDEPVTLRVTAANDKAKPLTLLAKSEVGGLTAAKPQAWLVYNLAAAGNVKLTLRVRYASLARGRSYRVVVVATAADGQSSSLVIPFRR
jgi:hypothetical protein